MHRVYENNFQCLIKLLPELQSPRSHLLSRNGMAGRLSVEVIEHHRYTTVIRLTQKLSVSLPLTADPVMTVRVYHDARVAEVLSYQHYQRFQPRYDYPNPDMCQRREKRRVNEFLGEWLRFSLVNNGHIHASLI